MFVMHDTNLYDVHIDHFLIDSFQDHFIFYIRFVLLEWVSQGKISRTKPNQVDPNKIQNEQIF